jgi:hypothetical protein
LIRPPNRPKFKGLEAHLDRFWPNHGGGYLPGPRTRENSRIWLLGAPWEALLCTGNGPNTQKDASGRPLGGTFVHRYRAKRSKKRFWETNNIFLMVWPISRKPAIVYFCMLPALDGSWSQVSCKSKQLGGFWLQGTWPRIWATLAGLRPVAATKMFVGARTLQLAPFE